MVLDFVKKIIKPKKEEKKLSYEDLKKINDKLKSELEATKRLLKKYELKEQITNTYEELSKTPVFVFNANTIYSRLRKSDDPRVVYQMAEAIKKTDLSLSEEIERKLKSLITYATFGVLILSLVSFLSYFAFKAYTSYQPPTKVITQYIVVDEKGEILGIYESLKGTPYEKIINKTKENKTTENQIPIYNIINKVNKE